MPRAMLATLYLVATGSPPKIKTQESRGKQGKARMAVFQGLMKLQEFPGIGRKPYFLDF
jgi:hypothetical protein